MSKDLEHQLSHAKGQLWLSEAFENHKYIEMYKKEIVILTNKIRLEKLKKLNDG